MERYKVSGSDLRNFYQDDISLNVVFNDIERDLRAENRVVCQYIVNGRALSEADEAYFKAFSLSDVETLEYLSENRQDLTLDLLHSWIEAIPEMIEFAQAVSSRMRSEGIQKVAQATRDLVQNCEILVESIIAIKAMVGPNISQPVEWSNSEAQCKRAVLESLVALNNKDFVQLADLIEYDLSHSLQLWGEHLVELESALNGEQHGSYRYGPNSLGRKRIAN